MVKPGTLPKGRNTVPVPGPLGAVTGESLGNAITETDGHATRRAGGLTPFSEVVSWPLWLICGTYRARRQWLGPCLLIFR